MLTWASWEPNDLHSFIAFYSCNNPSGWEVLLEDEGPVIQRLLGLTAGKGLSHFLGLKLIRKHSVQYKHEENIFLAPRNIVYPDKDVCAMLFLSLLMIVKN